MANYYGQQIKCEAIEGGGLSGEIRFVSRIKRGKGYERIAVFVPWQKVVEVARVLEQHDLSEGVGHAMWHYENPDREFPCETCRPRKVKV